MSWSQKGGHKRPGHKRPGHKRPGHKRPGHKRPPTVYVYICIYIYYIYGGLIEYISQKVAAYRQFVLVTERVG